MTPPSVFLIFIGLQDFHLIGYRSYDSSEDEKRENKGNSKDFEEKRNL